MNKSGRWARLAKLSGLLILASSFGSNANVHPNASVAEKNSAAVLTKLPLTFEANAGQVDPSVKFIARAPGFTLFATPKEMVTVLSGTAPGTKRTVVRTQLKGADHFAPIRGENPQQAKSNYLVGNDPKKWVSGAEHFSRIRQSGVYPGVDLVYHGDNAGLEYDFVVAPGADPKQIRLSFIGADKIAIDANGDLKLMTKHGELTQHKPVVYQVVDGARLPVVGEYVHAGKREIGFKVAAYDQSKELVIDPVVEYATYFGGSGSDRALAIAVDNAGTAYITGVTNSPDFPILMPIQGTNLSSKSLIFVSKINTTTNTLIYSTYLGGSATVSANGIENVPGAIAIDSSGNAYLAGWTNVTDFPMVNGFQTGYAGSASVSSGGDAFVTKLNPSGAALLFSSYLGGSGDEYARTIAVDNAGNVFAAGSTNSTDFPIRTSFQNRNGGPVGTYDGFVTKIDTVAHSLVYSTYLGGSDDDRIAGVAVDLAGHAFIAGTTSSTDFKTTPGAYQASAVGTTDGFVAKLSINGQSLDYSTRLGTPSKFTNLASVVLNSLGNAVVAGSTSTFSCFADATVVSGTFDNNVLSPTYGFLATLNSSGSAVSSNSCIGVAPTSFAIGADGSFFVSGTEPHPPELPFSSIFLFKLSTDGGLAYKESFPPGGDRGLAFSNGLAVDSSGRLYMTGDTNSNCCWTITSSNLGASIKGGADAFLIKIAPTTSTSVTLTVVPVVNLSVNQDVNLSASVTGATTGNVTFKAGDTVLSTQAITGGVATLKTTTLPTGANSIVVIYEGDTTHDRSISTPIQIAVAKAKPRANLNMSSTDPEPGESVTATVTIAGGYNPTGSVRFNVDGVEVPLTSTAPDSGTASAVFTSKEGRFTSSNFEATYLGDANNEPAVSNSIRVTTNSGLPSILGGSGGCTIGDGRRIDVTLPMLLVLALWGLWRTRRKVF